MKRHASAGHEASSLSPPAPAAPQPPALRPDSGAVRRKVLLADDHPLTRAGLAQLVNQRPDLVVCFEAADASEALAGVETHAPDLVITDLTMHGRGGLELIKDLAALKPRLPVLVVSMHDEMLHAQRTLRAGARGYVMKEAGAECVVEAIYKVLAGEVYVSARLARKIFDGMARPQKVPHWPIEFLTDREFAVFQLVGQGKPTREIARELGVSPKTVDGYRSSIKQKLGVNHSDALLRQAVFWVETEQVRGAPDSNGAAD